MLSLIPNCILPTINLNLRCKMAGCLVLLYGQRWLQTLVGVRFDDASEFNLDWYYTGGSNLIIIMTLNTIIPHVGSIVAYFRHNRRIRQLERDSHRVWYTQEELNDAYKGPEFQLNYKYTQVLVTIYVCWMYSISMPLLPVLGAISCYLSYWVEKFLFCNYYRTPPMYSDSMSKTSSSLLGCLVILHLVMSLWMMGCEEIFQGEPLSGREYSTELGHDIQSSNIGKKLLKKHLLPLELALYIFVACTLVLNISSTFFRKICEFLQCLLCMTGEKVRARRSSMNTVKVDYSSAAKRGIIKGVYSYDLLQNPTYKEAAINFTEGERRLSDHANLGRGKRDDTDGLVDV